MSRLPVTFRSQDKKPDPGLTPTRLFLAVLLAISLAIMVWVNTVT